MRTAVLVALVAAAAYATPLDIKEANEALQGQALVDHINSLDTTWKAKLNLRYLDMPIEKRAKQITGVAGNLDDDQMIFQLKNILQEHSSVDIDIPTSFDARAQWPQCPTIGEIRDQSDCGSCWSFATGEIISDRTCIATNGAKTVDISSDDIMTCCGLRCGNGCDGGYPLEALNWWVSTGVVTGGLYGGTGCKPYPFAPCEHHNDATTYQPCPSTEYSTPKCEKSCQAGYATPYAQDKQFGKQAYGLSKKVEDIQKDLLQYGPLSASFKVYADFEQYTSGIYQHKTGKYLGGHAVKLIGWGEENGTPYWLVANSWNEDWGEKGLFRIIRGTNECGFEASIVGGLPKV